MRVLRNAAGNLYINDKSTGSVVGQQPFGGSRLSGKSNTMNLNPQVNKVISNYILCIFGGMQVLMTSLELLITCGSGFHRCLSRKPPFLLLMLDILLLIRPKIELFPTVI